MIESIQIADIATYPIEPQSLRDLSTFNFIFGANATGKTTISRVLANESSFSTCRVSWKGGTRLQPMVYNHDFVETNFNQCTELKGVFTLGKKNIDTIQKITDAKSEIDTITKKIENLNKSLHGEDGTGGKKAELTELETDLKNKCWSQKQKHDAKLNGAFEGFRNNAEKFKGKVLQEWVSNSAELKTLNDLEKKADTLFGPAPTKENLIPKLDTDTILSHEVAPILKKRVVGKEDVDIASMIKRLGNSDWVKEGLSFYDANDMVCPFCQQSTTEAFAQSLNDYFDEAFQTDSKSIDDLSSNYKTDSARLQQQVSSIIAAPPKFLDVEKLKSEKELLDSTVITNIQRIASKKKESSRVVELESIGNIINAMNVLINGANVLVAEHNNMVANLTQERSDLTAQIWRYILDVELNVDLNSYKTKKDGLKKAIKALEEQIEAAKTKKMEISNEIRDLEKQTTSVQPTIDGINALLARIFHKRPKKVWQNSHYFVINQLVE